MPASARSTQQSRDMRPSFSLSLNKTLVVLLLGGFAFLLLEVRFEHRDVVSEKLVAYIPIVYSLLTLVVGAVLLALWDKGGRLLLQILFGGAVIVGALGVWFHTGGNPVRAVSLVGRSLRLLATIPPMKEAEPPGGPPAAKPAGQGEAAQVEEGPGEGGPPLLAPLAFCGLGLLGMAACARGWRIE